MRKNNKGFSLVELIIVIAIIAILTGILAPQFIKKVDDARKHTCLTNIDTIHREYLMSKAEGTATDPGTMNEIMDSHGLTSAGTNQYTGCCGAGGTYTVAYESDGSSVTITCDKHGTQDLALVPCEDHSTSISALQRSFQKLLDDGTITQTAAIDSNGQGRTQHVVEALTETLRSEGYTLSDTAVWAIKYNSTTNRYNFYWMDTGEAITADNNSGTYQGKQLQYDIATGKMAIVDANVILKNKTVDGRTFIAIDNGGKTDYLKD